MTTVRSAFTLAEVLAAIVLLAVLAAATFPLVRQLATGEAAVGSRRDARSALDAVVRSMRTHPVAMERQLDGSPWTVHCEPLRSDAAKIAGAATWWTVSLRDDQGEIVATTVVLAAGP